MAVFRLDADSVAFPPAHLAERDPNGLLAVGGDLSPERLLAAYRAGIFPWSSEEDLLLWWSPDPRAIVTRNDLHLSRSLCRFARRSDWRIATDTLFVDVVNSCAGQRSGQTWITPAMIDAYTTLHRLGHAHSIEVFDGNRLIGGLYGIAVGNIFCGESMFHLRDNASKVAFAALATTLFAAGWKAIDCQLPNAHLTSLGAREIPRTDFLDLLQHAGPSLPWPQRWLACARD